MTDTGLVKTIRCEGCGRALKPVALFCTACGTPREVEATAAAPTTPPPPPGAAAKMPPPPKMTGTSTCGACGVALRSGAEFCTECGKKVEPIDLTAAGTTTEIPETPSPSERVSPAASRAILGSVGGGMGSYVGKSTKGTGGPKVPVAPVQADEPGDNRKNLAVIAIIAAVLLLIGGIAVLVATQKSSDGSLKAGGGSRGDHEGSIVSGRSSDSSSDSTTGSSKDDHASTSASTSDSKGDSGSDTTTGSHSASSSGSSTGSSSSSSSGGSSSSGSKSPGRPGAAPPKGTTQTAPPVPPASLAVSASSVSLNGDNSAVIRISNTGGRSMYWSITNRSMNNGNLTVNGGGTLAGGNAVNVTVQWSGGQEGTAEGSFRINGAGRSQVVSVHGDSRRQDAVNEIRRCNSSCPSSSTDVSILVGLKAGGGAVPDTPTQVCFQVQASNPATQCWSSRDWYGGIVPGTSIYRFYTPFLWNSLTPGTTVIVWAVYPDGSETPRSSHPLFG